MEGRPGYTAAFEKGFRIAKSDLQARPVYHRKPGSIEAHLTVVFATPAVGRWIEQAGYHPARLHQAPS